MARAALKDIQIFNPYVNQNGSFNAYSYYDHGVESQENFRNAFPVTDQCERSAQLMGDDYVRLKFNLTAYVPMAAFSFIRYDGQTFFLMNDYCPHSNGSRMEHDQQGNEMVVSDSYEYDMKFYSVANMLRKPICYRHVKVAKGATAADGYHEWDEPEVTVSATLETMYVIIVQSIEQYTSRLDSDFLLTRMLATIPTNGLDNTGIAPKNTVKLTAGTELATFNFNGEKIADVCTAVANTYSDAKKETEWYIEEDAEHSLTLHFCKCVDTGSMNHADDFSYKKTEGVDRYTKPIKTGGLKKVDYSRDESNIPQVIIPFGSERNMTYQAVKGIDEVSQMQSTFGKRLRLKTNHTCTIDGTQYPTAAMQAKGITGAYAVTDKDGNTVPLGVDAHGGIANDKVNTGVEKVEYFDDVYPQCHFQVSKVDVRNKKKDGATIPEYTCEGKVVNAQGQEIQPEGDFYPIQIEEGTTLSVRFESGYLNGREFEIANKTSKKADDGSMQTNYTLRFVIVADGSIEDGTLIPSGNFKPNVGDKFALFNMKMPEAYITYAQEELAQKAYEKLMEYQDTVPDVKCTSDPDSFSGKDVYFGAQYTINSEKLGFTLNAQNRRVPIDFISRIVAYSYKLTKVNDVSFTLSSALVRGVLSEMAAAITNVSYATDSLGQRSVNLSRRGYRDASEVADMITNVTTEMMLVGNEKYQFQYTSEILPLHTNGVFTGLKVSYGQLQHTQQPYIDYANGGMWQIEPNASLNEDYQGNALDGTKPYYVFALCGTDSLDWATVILMDKDAAEAAGVYRKDAEISDQDAYPEYLLLGILSSEFAEEKNGQMTYERVFSPTNGFTAIEGGTITTEQIQDANRQLIIDFHSNPPRIIAKRGAQIIGNITFISSDGAETNLATKMNNVDEELAKEIGGENVLFVNNVNRVESAQDPEGVFKYELTYYSGSGNSRQHTYLPAGKYVFSAKNLSYGCDEHEWICQVHLEAINSSGTVKKSIYLHEGDIRDKLIEFTEPCYIALQLEMWTHEEHTQTQGFVSISNMQLQKGTKSTSYQNYMEHLANAIKGTTEINGGLVMLNVLMLKNEQGEVTAGMSGLQGTSLNPENVLLWGGGDYQEALNAADEENEVEYDRGDGTPITTLLKKDGKGKIGVFYIKGDRAVVKTDYGKVEIDDNEGIKCKLPDADETVAVQVTPKDLTNLSDLMNAVPVSGTIHFEDGGTMHTKRVDSQREEVTQIFVNGESFDDEVYIAADGTCSIKITAWEQQMALPQSAPQGTTVIQHMYAKITDPNGNVTSMTLVNNVSQTYTPTVTGTYTIEYWVRLEFLFNTATECDFSITYDEERDYAKVEWSYTRAKKQTMVAKGGLFTFQGDRSFLYYKDGYGLDCCVGNYRLKITTAGIFVDGLTNRNNAAAGGLYLDGETVKRKPSSGS